MPKKTFKPDEIISRLQEVEVLNEGSRREFNQVRPHSGLGYRPPAPESIRMPALAAPLIENLGVTLS